MNGQDGLLLWVLGGAGVLFLYSAWAKKSPQTVLTSTLGVSTDASPGGGTAASSPGTSTAVRPVNYSTGTNGGTAYLYDANGNVTGVVPAPYQGSPSTYIPGTVNV